jgi:hypothetical protein
MTDRTMEVFPVQPAKIVNLETRNPGSRAAMQPVTERDFARVPVKARASRLAPSCNDAGREPTQAPAGVQTKTIAQRSSIGGVHCQRDLSRAKSNTALPKAAGFVTSSSYPQAQSQTPNTWRSFAQAGDAVSFPYEHGATRKTAPTAILIACLSSFGRTLATGASFRFTSRATPTCRATVRSRQTRQLRPLYSTASKPTVRRHGLTTDVSARAAA